MRGRKFAALLCTFVISLNAASLAQTPRRPNQKPTPPEQEPEKQDIEKIVTGTNEVLLDAVVRDKKGHFVKDLHQSDFEVFEDGVPQRIQSFRIVSREPVAATSTSSTAAPATPTETPAAVQPAPAPSVVASSNRLGAVAMVFDRLSPEARTIARQAALGYIKDGIRIDDYVGVFRIDLALHAVQRFTNNEPLVREAIERAVSHGSSTYASNAETIAKLAERQASLQDQISNSASGGGEGNDPSGSIGAAAADATFAAMTQNILEGFDRLEKNQQGYATTDGLLAIINELGRLPGRKALVFFSEGVVLPTEVMPHYRSVISNANRANVSIYSVDAAGLRSSSADVGVGGALTKLGQARARVAASNRDPFGSMMKDLERNEELMRSNPESGLRALADETGGVFIANTNDPGTRMRQVGEDLHSYYVLSYTPTNQNYDGHFRQISLKMTRPGLEIQSRRGYFALANVSGSPVLSYEAPALAILGSKAQPSAFPSRTAAFSFPESDKPGLVPVLVEIPGDAIGFIKSPEKKSYGTNFSVVVLIKDEAQRVVRKLSNQYLLSGPIANLEKAKRGTILFYREALLEPGNYTINSVVYDATTNRASSNVANVTVPAADSSNLKLSSIVVIKRAERVPKDQEASNPLHFEEVMLYPNLGEPVQKSVSKDLALFVTVYPPRGDTFTPKLNLEVARGGKPVGQFSYDLPRADQSGRIQYASAIPLDKFQPGDYELKVAVQDGARRVARSERVRIAP
jgi:VWFA-related protein